MRKGIGIFVFILIAIFSLSALVMFLWNYAVVSVFNIAPLSYWQAMALLVLSKILLGGFPMRPPGGRPGFSGKWRQKWGKMSEEERLKFREEWKRRCQQRMSSEHQGSTDQGKNIDDN